MANKDAILMDMLTSVSDEHDKRPGNFFYDALAPAAEQFEKVDAAIEAAKKKLDIRNLTGEELEQRIYERTGIERKPATHAIGTATLAGTGMVRIGDLFETPGGIQFRVTETKAISGSGTVSIEAVVVGADGNVPANTITLFPITLAGFTSVTNPSPTADGFDAESDDDLLQRYYERIRTPATSGNKAHYKNWAKEVPGVGDARVIPLWAGDNTVKVVIIDSDKKPASSAIVADVQEYIDPGVTGTGEGAAPLGAFVTVVSAAGVSIDVSVTITLSAGYTLQQLTENISMSLTQYLKDIAFVEPMVSYAKVGATILESEGVEDYSGLTVNGGTANISVSIEEVAILGEVIVNV
ncbi:baseplate J/gp47 family protein [Brevibacillus agri]|uniref:baseplate J/gp47 family protein n=1 Tax=Brevibacillus agri TaxID=51101 RepID=UPI002E1DFB15|nr:baseplate J/gp47 family protein [Brevibacillus agri]MED1654416.1 baseplate J/gp47 family protein [Brevibacillus agri]MED1688099.1 baseplate J/gp47 family protein [Brevibacillus agri]MED1691171.1 baseplate J/gp47 family protein [Brevibacillus agri]MED1699407.1 baseplate J/gp47 family protein [Brevibacillus agri]